MFLKLNDLLRCGNYNEIKIPQVVEFLVARDEKSQKPKESTHIDLQFRSNNLNI